MKKNYAHNDRGQKCFCKYETLDNGILRVVLFVPIYKFSIYWPLNKDLIKITDIIDTMDGRKTMITFHIHPTAWLGKSFSHRRYCSIQETIDRAFSDFINLY